MRLAIQHIKTLLESRLARIFLRVSIVLFLILSAFISSAQSAFSEDMLDYPMANQAAYDSVFEFEEVQKFYGECRENQVFLFNGFNEFYIDNPDLWRHLRKTSKAIEVDIVYSAYPENFRRWKPEFCTLLTRRLKALFFLDPKLNSQNIKWKLIEQTECNSIDEATALLHGIIITYQPKVMEQKPLADLSTLNLPISDLQDIEIDKPQFNSMSTDEIEYKLRTFGKVSDSVVLKVLDRHPEWNNMLVVVDWTSSMYPYGSQVVLWQALHLVSSGIKHLEFFNDGNSTLNIKKIGKTGGIYFTDPNNLETVIATMHWVRQQGDGGDIPENDIEAILKGLKAFPNVDDVILIADNNSEMRDFELADEITKPVKVILCGDYLGINPQYLSLALRTGGSVHTLNEDITDLLSKFEGQYFEFNGFRYAMQSDSTVQIWKNETISSVEP